MLKKCVSFKCIKFISFKMYIVKKNLKNMTKQGANLKNI